MEQSEKKNLVVVTGGTKGIGRAIIERFAKENFPIATCARNADDLKNLEKNLKDTYGIPTFTQAADLSCRTQGQKFADFVHSINLPVAVLVNNAGVFIPGAIYQENTGTLEKMLATNLYSAYDLSRALVGKMIENRSGHIFNICSIASTMAYANGGSYAISKHALYGLSKCLRQEMTEKGVRVTAVLPGATFTDSWSGVELPESRFSSPEDIALMVYAAFSLSPRSVVEEILIRPQLGDL